MTLPRCPGCKLVLTRVHLSDLFDGDSRVVTSRRTSCPTCRAPLIIGRAAVEFVYDAALEDNRHEGNDANAR